MLNIKIIGSLALVFGAVACDPLPVYPPNGSHNSRRKAETRDQRPELRDYRNSNYFGDENRGSLDLRNDGRYGSRDVDRDPLGEYEDRDQRSKPSTYPTAESTANPDRVISPYSPYNVIDVEGFRSGQLAKDPSNGKIFRIP